MIHYKFKSATSNSRKWDSIGIEGSVVSVLDLKRSIVQQKKLSKSNADFDLMITNASTGEGLFYSLSLFPGRTRTKRNGVQRVRDIEKTRTEIDATLTLTTYRLP